MALMQQGAERLLLEMLALIDSIASCSWWKFVGYTSWARSSRSTTSQRCSIGFLVLWGPF